MSIENRISDSIVSLLLRMRRFDSHLELQQPKLAGKKDTNFLKIFWAYSKTVKDLVDYLGSHPHEASAVLQVEKQASIGKISGKLNARETVMRQIMTGNLAEYIASAPKRTYLTNPNQLLVWVLNEAKRLALEASRTVEFESEYGRMFNDLVNKLERVSKYESIRAASSQVDFINRPALITVPQSMRSRSRFYKLAADAYLFLIAIESGDEEKIKLILEEGLLGPADIWMRYELYVGLSAANALSSVLMQSVNLTYSFGDDGLLATVGKYKIYWQSRTKLFVEPTFEPSELKVKRILNSLGMKYGWDRPDVVIVDDDTKVVVSVIEVKYFANSSNDGKSAVRAAIEQIVRYARGYTKNIEDHHLLSNSIIAPIRFQGGGTQSHSLGIPNVIDMEAIEGGALNHWASTLILSNQKLGNLLVA